MNQAYPFVVSIQAYDLESYENYHTNALVYGHSFTEAIEAVEKYFGDELISCTITAVNDENTIFIVDDNTAKTLIDNDGIMPLKRRKL